MLLELALVGAATFSKPTVSINDTTASGYSSKPGFGGGALLGLDLSSAIQLELGALYITRHYSYPNPSGTAEDSFPSFEIPVIFRVIALKYLTFGGGAYLAIPTGQDTYTVTPSGGTGTSSQSSAKSTFKDDAGLVGSVAIKLPLGLVTSFLVDGRYYYGITNGSNVAGTTENFRDAQVLVGIDFGI